MTSLMNNYSIYINSIQRESGESAYGVVIVAENGKEVELSRGFRQSELIRMDTKAMIRALKFIGKNNRVTVYSSNCYLQQMFTNRCGFVAPRDLYSELLNGVTGNRVYFSVIANCENNGYLQHCRELAEEELRHTRLYKDKGCDQPNEIKRTTSFGSSCYAY